MKIGDLVVAPYKSGIYIGELLQLERPRAKVRMLAVLKHPTQGDLHHPLQADVPFFHERRALAHREVANVMAAELAAYEGGEAPDYIKSLRTALAAEIEAMQRLGTEFGQLSVKRLEQLSVDYFGP